MELPREPLNKLSNLDYEELKSLRRKENLFRLIFCGTASLLSLTLYCYLVFLLYNSLSRDWLACLPIILFYSFILLIGAVIEYYPEFFDYIFRNTGLRLKIKDLETKFSVIEKQVFEQLRTYVQSDAKKLIRQLKRDFSNRKNCENLADSFLKNDSFVSDAGELLSSSQLKKQYLRILKEEKVSVEDGLIKLPPQPENQNTSQPIFTKTKTGWWKNYRNYNNPLSLKIETDRSPRPFTPTPNKPKEPEIKKADSPETETTEFSRQRPIRSDSKNATAAPKRGTKPKASKTTREAKEPVKVKTPRQGRIFQPSEDYYRRVADRRMEIGKKGELFVMEHEKQRLILEEGADYSSKLEHSSVVRGDGLGYDILSYENDKEIYIEVKTTTGKFSSNVFFTENEFNTMSRYVERYYLYRVYEFNEETNIGQIIIFKGKEMIESYFDFSPKVYVLTQKSE